MVQIRNRYTGEILIEKEVKTIKELVEIAIKEKIILRGADLYEAYLREADLRGAYLRGADLYRAYLYRADLRGADLREADLCEAYLREADLRGADLRGTKLNCIYHKTKITEKQKTEIIGDLFEINKDEKEFDK